MVNLTMIEFTLFSTSWARLNLFKTTNFLPKLKVDGLVEKIKVESHVLTKFVNAQLTVLVE